MIRYHLGTVWDIEKDKNTTGQILRSTSHNAVELSLMDDYILDRVWGADLGLIGGAITAEIISHS